MACFMLPGLDLIDGRKSRGQECPLYTAVREPSPLAETWAPLAGRILEACPFG